jgi:hypothetical protein
MFTLDPGSEFFHPGSSVKRFWIAGPDPHNRFKVFLIQKIVYKLYGMFIPDPDIGSGSRIRILIFFTYPGSRGQKGTGSRIRIRNPVFGLLLVSVRVWVWIQGNFSSLLIESLGILILILIQGSPSHNG